MHAWQGAGGAGADRNRGNGGLTDMRRLRIQRFTTAGVALATTALFVAACGSSGSSGSSSGSGSSGLSGTLNGSGSTFQLTFQQTAIQSFKSVQSGMTVN